MADILIRGMEMPTKCGLCPMFCDDFNDYCSAAQRSIPFDAEKPEWCPFVPFPKGHGRLGDLDKLEESLRMAAAYQTGERQQGILGCCETIRMAKTIIPAEGGTDECSEN